MQWDAEARKFHDLSAQIADYHLAMRQAADERAEILRTLRLAGLTIREVAAVVNLSSSRVWRILSQGGD